MACSFVSFHELEDANPSIDLCPLPLALASLTRFTTLTANLPHRPLHPIDDPKRHCLLRTQIVVPLQRLPEPRLAILYALPGEGAVPLVEGLEEVSLAEGFLCGDGDVGLLTFAATGGFCERREGVRLGRERGKGRRRKGRTVHHDAGVRENDAMALLAWGSECGRVSRLLAERTRGEARRAGCERTGCEEERGERRSVTHAYSVHWGFDKLWNT